MVWRRKGGLVANVYVELPDPLVERAHRAGISIDLVVEDALRAKLTEHKTSSSAVGGDDAAKYRAGFSLGTLWASGTATPSEILEVTAWREGRWNHFTLDVSINSLPGVYCEARGEEPLQNGHFTFERTPHTEGVIDGAASVLNRAMGAPQS
jgi:post-segregation antitoxin (ccd killing protein)